MTFSDAQDKCKVNGRVMASYDDMWRAFTRKLVLTQFIFVMMSISSKSDMF